MKSYGPLNLQKAIEDRKPFKEALENLFPEKDYEYSWLVSGVTIKPHHGRYPTLRKGRGIVTIDEC
jgi:hypothetical protein